MSDDFWGSHDLVASCLGTIVQAWNPFTSSAKHATLPDHYSLAVNTVRWTYNSKVLACGGDRGTVSLYNNGSYLGGLPGALDKGNAALPSMDAIQCLRITKDSKTLVAGCKNKLIFVWDLKTQSIRGTISNHKASISSLFLSPDDNILASASAAGDVLLHQMSTSNKLGQLPVEDSKTKRSLCFTPCDPTLLAAASEDGSVYVWNIKSLTVATLLKQKHTGGAMGVQLSPSQPQLLFTCGMDKRFVVWDRRAEQEGQVATTTSAYTSLCVRDDSVHIAAGTAGGVLLVYDVRKLAAPIARLSDSSVPGAPVLEVHWKRSSSSRRSSVTANNVTGTPISQQTSAATTTGTASAAIAARAQALGDGTSTPTRSNMPTPMQLDLTPEGPKVQISPVSNLGVVTNSFANSTSSIPPKSPRLSLPMPASTRPSITGGIATTGVTSAPNGIDVNGGSIPASQVAAANGGSVVRRMSLAAGLPCLGADMGKVNSNMDANAPKPPAASSVPVIQAGLSEEVFKAYMDQATANMNSTIQNLHVDLLRQFTITQLQMQARYEEMAARQDALQAQVAALQTQLEQFIQVQRWSS